MSRLLGAVVLVAGIAACDEQAGGADAGAPDETADATVTTTTVSDTTTTTSDTTTTTSSEEADSDLLLGSAGSWDVEDVEQISLGPDNTAQVIDPSLADDRAMEDHWMWDWWPVRDRAGNVADIDGWNVAIALSAPANVLPGQRHDIAQYRYLVSDDGGATWSEGGELFPSDEALGSRQWAGSAMYDDETGEIYVFYTAAGEDGENNEVPTIDEILAEQDSTTETETETETGTETEAETETGTETETETETENATETESGTDTPPSAGGDYQSRSDISYEQRLALVVGQAQGDEQGVTFSDWGEHTILLEGDDEFYMGTAQTEGGAGEIDAFRDPWYFEDPDTGEVYLLFTATMPDAGCPGDGVVGIASSVSDDLTEWQMEPPLFDGHCVNNELERPQIVVQDSNYYLLFTTHSHTFDEGLEAPEGLYGFVASELFGEYEPLNGSGLVVANPEERPYQAYSWMTLPNGIVTSFFQYFDLEPGQDLTYVGSLNPQEQIDSFGGTFAPSLLIEFDGDTTRIVEELAPGQLEP